QTRDETGANRVRCRREDYRDDRCCPLCRENYWGCICDNDIDFKSDELGSELGGPIAASLRPAILDDEVATLGPAEFAQPLQKSSDPTALGCGHRYRAQEPDGGQLARLLRARRERPRGCGAAEQRDEGAPIHSITSSARACERAMTRDGTVGRSGATERSLPFHWDIDPARMMRPRFADSIRASSPSGLREQAGHMTASDFCAARCIFSCQAGAIHT